MLVRLELASPRFPVKHSTTEPLHSQRFALKCLLLASQNLDASQNFTRQEKDQALFNM